MREWAQWVVGVGVAACAAVSCFPSMARAEGLHGLDAKLSGTGRIGTYTPEAGQIAPASDGGGAPATSAASRARDAVPALAKIDGEAAARALRPSDDGNGEVRSTEGPVAACHLEVARRRHLPPAKVAAGTVVLRFTIDKDGRVRDAEALSADGTDLEVAACAKRVLSEWVFAKRAQGGMVVERMYRFVGPSS
jgi:hypothetical protein